MRRLASIDVGTNTVLLSVVEHDPGAGADPGNPAIFRVIAERGAITRLGKNVSRTRRLDPDHTRATLDCLRDYRSLLDELGVSELKVLGTSALRDAQGSDLFLEEARGILGVPLEVISGRREAELTYKGAHVGSPLPPSGDRFVFDIGGGSTELIWGSGPRSVDHAISLNVGSVRLYEELKPSDPPTLEELSRLQNRIREMVDSARLDPALWEKSTLAIGVAGTVTSLSAIAHDEGHAELGAQNGKTLELPRAREVFERLAKMSVKERTLIPCLGEGRADVIVCGAAIALALMELIDAARADRSQPTSLVITDRGVRYGALLELVSS